MYLVLLLLTVQSQGRFGFGALREPMLMEGVSIDVPDATTPARIASAATFPAIRLTIFAFAMNAFRM